jgi:hypothetical protein
MSDTTETRKARLERAKAEGEKRQAEAQKRRDQYVKHAWILSTSERVASFGAEELEQELGRTPQEEELFIYFAKRVVQWVKALEEGDWWRHLEALPPGGDAKEEAIHICRLAKQDREQEIADALKEIDHPDTPIGAFGSSVIEWLRRGLMDELLHRDNPQTARRNETNTVLDVATQIRNGLSTIRVCGPDVPAFQRWIRYCHQLDGRVTSERLNWERARLSSHTGKDLPEINLMAWRDFVDAVLRLDKTAAPGNCNHRATQPEAKQAHSLDQASDITTLPMLPIAPDVPDLGTATTVPEFWDWCNRHRDNLRQFRVSLGAPQPASVAIDEFRLIPEVVHQCRNLLLGFGAAEIPERFTFPTLPRDQTPTGLAIDSPMEGFLAWASAYRTPGHGIMWLIGEVEEFLTWAMAWTKQQGNVMPASPAQENGAATVRVPGETIEKPGVSQLANAQGLSSGSRGQTPEQLVSWYIGKSPRPQIDEVVRVTGLSKLRIQRTQAWKRYEEKALDDYLQAHPDASTRDVEREFGFSPPKTVGMVAWDAHNTRKEAAKPPQKVKEQRLTETIARFRADERAANPCAQVDDRDQLFRTILERADPNVRGQLNRLSAVERNGLLEYILSKIDATAMNDKDREKNLAIVLEVTKSWLDEFEQNQRHESRTNRRI